MDVDFGDIQQTGGGGGGGGDGGGGGGGDDITSELLQKFSCMNTTDREVLIQQFKVLLGEKCSESSAEFWLDMNNWNLQAAVCSYFDYESQNSSAFMIKLPSMSFVADPQFVDRMPPNAPFVYRCILTNSGDETWPLGCSLRFCGGTQMTNEERVLLPTLVPGQSAEVKLSMIAPENGGGHSCQWRPATITGQFFGETIFIIVNVIADDSLLQAVTRQLSDAHLGVINSAGGELSTASSAEAAAAAAAAAAASTTTTTTSTSILNFDSPFSPSTTSACVPCTTSPLLLSSSSSSSSSSNFASLPAFRANLITAPSTAIALPAPNRFSNWIPGMCIPGSTAAGYLPHPQPDQQQPQMIEQQPQQPQQSTGTLPNGFVSYDHTHHSHLSYSHQHQPNQQQHSNNDSMDNDDNDDDDNLIRSETTTAPAGTREQITSLSSPPLSSTTTSSSSSSSSASTINHHQHQHQHQFPLALTHIPNSSSNQQQQMNPNFNSSLCSTNAITNPPTTTTATPSLSSNIIMINGATSNAATLATSIADEDIGEDSFMS